MRFRRVFLSAYPKTEPIKDIELGFMRSKNMCNKGEATWVGL